MCVPCRVKWFLVALVALAIAGAGLYGVLRPGARQSPSPVAATPPVAISPATTPEAAATTAPAPAKASSKPLTEAQFVEISSTVVIGAVQFGDRPDAVELLQGLTEKVVREAGVNLDEFNALGEAISADPARKQRVAEAILKRVEERTTPEIRMKAAPQARDLRNKLQKRILTPPEKEQ